MLNGIDQPSTDKEPKVFPPSSTAGGAAKSNDVGELGVLGLGQVDHPTGEHDAHRCRSVEQLLLHLGLVEGRHLRIHVGQQALHLLKGLARLGGLEVRLLAVRVDVERPQRAQRGPVGGADVTGGQPGQGDGVLHALGVLQFLGRVPHLLEGGGRGDAVLVEEILAVGHHVGLGLHGQAVQLAVVAHRLNHRRVEVGELVLVGVLGQEVVQRNQLLLGPEVGDDEGVGLQDVVRARVAGQRRGGLLHLAAEVDRVVLDRDVLPGAARHHGVGEGVDGGGVVGQDVDRGGRGRIGEVAGDLGRGLLRGLRTGPAARQGHHCGDGQTTDQDLLGERYGHQRSPRAG